MKKKLCVIGLAEVVCDFMGSRLRALIGDYVDVTCWCLETTNQAPPPKGHDLYLATYPGSYEFSRRTLPADAPLLLAGRFVNPSNFDRLLELPRGQRVLAVDNSLERANYLIWEIARFRINHLDIVPYYPGCPEPAGMAQAVAVGAGRKRNVPDWMEFIDLGVKELTLTTYEKILEALSIPAEVIDSVAHSYMDSVFQTVCRSYNLWTHLNAIINNIDEIIFGVSESGKVLFTNNAAKALASSLEGNDVIYFSDIFHDLELPFNYYYKNNKEEIVTKTNGQYYVVQIKAVNNSLSSTMGAIVVVKPVARVQELENKVRRKLKAAGLTAKYSFSSILGESPAIRQAEDMARKFARTPLTVLLEGESGVGKELFAQSIHQASPFSGGPFVAFNFSALPEALAESELFGYEEGAFTGARLGGKPGLFEQAHNGTIFLDELGNASLAVQARLLRVLEEREVRRLGGQSVLPISVRVIAATNESLMNMIHAGRFRKDLFYRICACPLRVPPLREREGDVMLLAKHFAATNHSHNLRFSKELETFCSTYDWPGNVRELQNMVTYLCTVVPSGHVCTLSDLPHYLGRHPPGDSSEANPNAVVRDELTAAGGLNVFRIILEIYNTKKQRLLGRKALLDLLKQDHQDITDHALRHYLAILKEHDLLHAGATKQGTEITPFGRRFLGYLGSGPIKVVAAAR